jgi:hypothetical protein
MSSSSDPLSFFGLRGLGRGGKRRLPYVTTNSGSSAFTIGGGFSRLILGPSISTTVWRSLRYSSAIPPTGSAVERTSRPLAAVGDYLEEALLHVRDGLADGLAGEAAEEDFEEQPQLFPGAGARGRSDGRDTVRRFGGATGRGCAISGSPRPEVDSESRLRSERMSA